MSSAPLVFVIIPCRNEAHILEATVRAVLKSRYPNLELLLVDGMSDDGTRQICERMVKDDSRVRLLENPHKFQQYALNVGVAQARGEYVQILSAKTLLAPDYISILVDVLQRWPDVACAGGQFQHVAETRRSRYLAMALESRFGGGARTPQKDHVVKTLGVPLYRKSVFEDMGLFDEHLKTNQDEEFNFRLIRKGYKILYVHRAKATQRTHGDLRELFQDFFQHGYFKVFVDRKHRTLTSFHQLVPPLFVAFWVLGLPFAAVSFYMRNILSGVAFIYLLLGLLSGAPDMTAMDRFRVLGLCFVLQVAYGVGYWKGVWDFLIWRGGAVKALPQYR